MHKLWVRSRLDHIMVPKHVFLVDKMPLTASGKIEKYKLREHGIKALLEKSQQHESF